MAIEFPTDENDQVLRALRIAQSRGILPTSMGTAELRQLSRQIRATSVFSARVTSARFATTLKQLSEELVSGEMDPALARLTLRRLLEELGYTPEGGFPEVDEGDDPGPVPPAVAGTLQDIMSERRVNLMIQTQTALLRGAAYKFRGMEADAIEQYPYWELVRFGERRVPRDWFARAKLALANLDMPAELPRDAEGRERICFPKGHAIWPALGASEIFDDALDVDHRPFAFSTGMDWMQRSSNDVSGWTGLAELGAVPVTAVEVPAPQASTAGIDPDLARSLQEDLAAEEAENGVLKIDWEKYFPKGGDA